MESTNKARLNMLVKKHKDNMLRIPVERDEMIRLFMEYYAENEAREKESREE